MVILSDAAERLDALAAWSRRQYKETGSPGFELDARACDAAAAILAALGGEGAETVQEADRLIKKYPLLLSRCRRAERSGPIQYDGRHYRCPACGREVGKSDAYCRACGEKLEVYKA